MQVTGTANADSLRSGLIVEFTAETDSHGTIKGGPKNVLVIGASTGYGLAPRITAAFGSGAKTLGVAFAAKAKAAGLASVVFDRNGRLYHGRVKTFAEAAREGGLQF